MTLLERVALLHNYFWAAFVGLDIAVMRPRLQGDADLYEFRFRHPQRRESLERYTAVSVDRYTLEYLATEDALEHWASYQVHDILKAITDDNLERYYV